jgi:hypothetical protein
MNICVPEKFAELLARQKASGLSLVEVEREMLGFDHAVIGAEMAKRWNFPPKIEHAIHYWRMPESVSFEPITGMVHVAVLIESGLSGEALMSRLPKTLCGRLQLSWERIEPCMPVPEELDAAAKLMLET